MNLRFTQIAAAMLLGAGVSAMAQDAPNYVVIAEGPTTVTESKLGDNFAGIDGNSQNSRGWYGYGNFSGCQNLKYTLPEDCSEVYFEMDICVNNTEMEAGAPVFTDIVWGATEEGVYKNFVTGETIIENDKEKTWKEPVNYFFVQFQYADGTGVSGNWTYADAVNMNECYAEFLNNLKIGEWAHLSLPLSASPNFTKMGAKDFKNINVYFGRIFNNKYVFQGKNVKLVDHSREVVDKVIPTRFTFDSSMDQTIGGVQGEKGGNLYFQFTMSPTVDLSSYVSEDGKCENVYLCFDADITLVDPTADAEYAIDQLINSSAGHGQGDIELRSGTVTDHYEVACRSKECGWQMGKHTYRIPLSKFTSASTEAIDWSAVKSGRFFLYNDSPDYPALNVKFSNFSFVTPVEKGADEEFEQPTIIDKPIETGYVFTQPSNAVDGVATSVLGNATEHTSAFFTFSFADVNVPDWEDASFAFDVEITPVEGEADEAMLKNITGAGGQGLILKSTDFATDDWNSQNVAGYYAIKNLDWKFGKHTYSVALSQFQRNNVVDWTKVTGGRLYVYDDETGIAPVKFSLSNLRFTIPAVSDGSGDEDDDDVTSIENVYDAITAESYVVIYNLSGVQVYAGVYGEAQLPHGLYVVVGAKGSKKVMF